MTSKRGDLLGFRGLGVQQLSALKSFQALEQEQQNTIQAIAAVLPFRVNRYVIDQLIDWDNIETDPIFRMTFPQEEMLLPEDLKKMRDLISRGATSTEKEELALPIRAKMNPHPAGQTTHNLPVIEGEVELGIQHKYDETVLFFPAAGQTCHTYCSYCFRWAQFVKTESIKLVAKNTDRLIKYLEKHPEITDVLITGGDPLTMKTPKLQAVIEPLLAVPTVKSIRIGTKSLTWWPARFVTDPDADNLLRLFERVVESGRHLALMAHFTHPRELSTSLVGQAVRRIQNTGALIRAQAPILRGVNDEASTWRELWRTEVQKGIVPYYMFVARDTGPKGFFEVPLAKAFAVFREAYQSVSGLARTVRGPSMSAMPGKVSISDILEIDSKPYFLATFLQARNPKWAGRSFLAEFDQHATWLSDLKPAFGYDRFFFEETPQIV